MEASLSFEQIKDISHGMMVEVPFTAVDVDENVLLFLFMTDNTEKVNRLKNSNAMAVEVQYIKNIDAFAIWIVPSEFVQQFSSRINISDYAVCGIVRVDDKRAFQALNDIANGKATAQIYTFDKKLSSISVKQVFTNELAITALKREINKQKCKRI